MADIDSLSISLSADTSSAEESINKLIGRLALLKVAVQGASNFTKIAGGIAKIAEAARKIDEDSGKKLSNLAHGLMDLSKVGDLSNLSTAGKNLSSIVKAVNGIGNTTGGGLGGLASEIERTGSALDSIKSADTSKLREIQDALSGETSGPLYTSSRQHESAELGGGSATYGTSEGMLALPAFDLVSANIRDATAAFREFVGALGGGVPPIFTEFVDEVRTAKTEVLELNRAIMGLLTSGPQIRGLLGGGVNWEPGSNGDTFWRRGQTPLLSGAPNFTAGSSGLDLSRAIETEFVDAENRFADYTMRPLEAEMPRITLMPVDDGAAESVSNLTSAFSALGSVLGGVGRGLGSVGKVLFAIPKYFGGQLTGNIQKATNGFGKFFNQIKRIAMYRAIRAALRLITQHIGEGIKNLYNWSNVANGTFAASMNKISTASHYMGNSFAAMVSPLINALAPAIDYIANKVVALFNLINQLFARLTGQTSYTAAKKFTTQWDSASKSASGSAKKAADEIKRTLLGFDEINKLNDNNETSSGGGGGGGGGGASAADMFETLPIDSEVASFADSLKAAFEAGKWQELGTLLGNKVNEIVESIDWAGYGAKVGYYINGWFETKYWTLDTINFTNIGAHIAEFLNNAINEINFNILGRLMVQKLGIIGDMVIGFFMEFDWGQAGEKLSNFVTGIFQELTKWIEKQNWRELGVAIVYYIFDFFGSADYSGMAKSISEFLGSALGAGIALLSGIGETLWEKIVEAVNGIGNYIDEIRAAGGNVALGILNGILEGIKNIGAWIVENIFQPFLNGLKSAFGIASPAKTMEEPGKNIVLGILQGMLNALANIGQWVKDNIFTPIWNAIKGAGETVIEITVSLVRSVGEWASDAWNLVKSGSEVIKKTVQVLAGAIASFTSDAWAFVLAGAETIKKTVQAVAGAIASFTSDAWSFVLAGSEVIKKTVQAVAGSIASFTSEAWRFVLAGAEVIKKTVQAVAGSIASFTSEAWTFVLAGAETIKKTVQAVAGSIASFTSDAWEFVKAGAETFTKTVQAVAGVITGFFGDVWSFVKAGTETFTKTVTTVLEKAAGWLTDVWDFITGPESIFKKIVITTENEGDFSEVEDSFKGGKTADGLPVELPVSIVPTISDDSWMDDWQGQYELQVGVDLIRKGWDSFWGFLGIKSDNPIVNTLTNLGLGTVNALAQKVIETKNGSNIVTTLSAGVTKATTWVTEAFQATQAEDRNVLTKTSQIKGGSWDPSAYLATIADDKSVLTKTSQIKGNSWDKSAYKATTATDKEPTTTVTLKKAKGSDWNDKAYKMATKTTNTITTKLNLAIGSAGSAVKNVVKAITSFFGWDTGGVIVGGRARRFASGGVITGNLARYLDSVPHYASGTTSAHGTVFIAGEAGPEIMGHINGRTEILNKSQLAQAMYSAVHTAMKGVTLDANFYDNGGGGDMDYDTMYRAMYNAFSAALARGDERDREKLALMREIAAKDFNPEITAASINRAQTRLNRRAGTTIVPVGT